MSADTYDALQTAAEHLQYASGILYAAKFAASHGGEVDPEKMLDTPNAIEVHVAEAVGALKAVSASPRPTTESRGMTVRRYLL